MILNQWRQARKKFDKHNEDIDIPNLSIRNTAKVMKWMLEK